MPDSFRIESELRLPLPRRVRPRGAGVNLWARGLLMLCIPHTLVGIAALLFALSQLLLPFGPRATGTVLDHKSGRTSKGGVYYSVHVTYPVNGATRDMDKTVSFTSFQQLPVGSTVPVQVHPFFAQATLLDRPGALFLEIAAPWGFTLFWDGIVSIFLWQFWFRFVVMKRLIAGGTPTVARIVGKRQVKGVCYLDYQFTPAAASPRKGSMEVDSAAYEKTQVGEELTVLYFEKHPIFSTLYQHAAWQVTMGY